MTYLHKISALAISKPINNRGKRHKVSLKTGQRRTSLKPKRSSKSLQHLLNGGYVKTRCLSNLQIVKHLNDSSISLRYELIGWCKRTCGRVLMTPNKITVRYVNWGEHVRNQNNLLLGLATGKRWSYVTKQGRKYRNSKTIHFLSTHPTCKKGKPPLKGFGLIGTRAKYLCFQCRYGIQS